MPKKMPTFAYLTIASLSLTACMTARSTQEITAATPTDAYLEREDSQRVATDRCGPAFIQDKLPTFLVNLVGPLTDGPFRPVCARHDACYRLGEKDQSWCDDRMKDEMLTICSAPSTGSYKVPFIGKPLCEFHAGVYYTAINNTFASVAYEGLPGGEITDIRLEVIEDRFSDNELTICADVKNPTKVMQEYDIELHDANGRMIDREPDTHETNVRPGETKEFCVGTNFTPLWSISDLTETLYISIRADTPSTFAITNDMVIVDTREIKRPALQAAESN